MIIISNNLLINSSAIVYQTRRVSKKTILADDCLQQVKCMCIQSYSSSMAVKIWENLFHHYNHSNIGYNRLKRQYQKVNLTVQKTDK